MIALPETFLVYATMLLLLFMCLLGISISNDADFGHHFAKWNYMDPELPNLTKKSKSEQNDVSSRCPRIQNLSNGCPGIQDLSSGCPGRPTLPDKGSLVPEKCFSYFFRKYVFRENMFLRISSLFMMSRKLII